MGGVVGTGTSATKPLSGQNNRSGPDFSLMDSYDGGSITVSAPSGVVFNIMKDVTWGTDPTPVSDATNGTVISGGTLSTGSSYYIANPQHASEPFAVILSQN